MQAAPAKTKADSPPRVGFVTDMGPIDDGTFNQYGYEGLMRAAQERDIAVEIIQIFSDRTFHRLL